MKYCEFAVLFGNDTSNKRIEYETLQDVFTVTYAMTLEN